MKIYKQVMVSIMILYTISITLSMFTLFDYNWFVKEKNIDKSLGFEGYIEVYTVTEVEVTEERKKEVEKLIQTYDNSEMLMPANNYDIHSDKELYLVENPEKRLMYFYRTGFSIEKITSINEDLQDKNARKKIIEGLDSFDKDHFDIIGESIYSKIPLYDKYKEYYYKDYVINEDQINDSCDSASYQLCVGLFKNGLNEIVGVRVDSDAIDNNVLEGVIKDSDIIFNDKLFPNKQFYVNSTQGIILEQNVFLDHPPTYNVIIFDSNYIVNWEEALQELSRDGRHCPQEACGYIFGNKRFYNMNQFNEYINTRRWVHYTDL